MYSCICNKEYLQFFNSLSLEIKSSYVKFIHDFPNCIHIEAVAVILSNVDAFYCITPDMDFEGVAVDFNHCLSSVDTIFRSYLCFFQYQFKYASKLDNVH